MKPHQEKKKLHDFYFSNVNVFIISYYDSNSIEKLLWKSGFSYFCRNWNDAKQTRTVCRWNDTNPARFWSIPSDPRLIFDPTTYVGVSSSCICLSIMVKLFNIDKLEQFWWKWPFDPWNPKWPQVGIWPHNIGRGSQAYTHVSYCHAM